MYIFYLVAQIIIIFKNTSNVPEHMLGNISRSTKLIEENINQQTIQYNIKHKIRVVSGRKGLTKKVYDRGLMYMVSPQKGELFSRGHNFTIGTATFTNTTNNVRTCPEQFLPIQLDLKETDWWQHWYMFWLWLNYRPLPVVELIKIGLFG